jgi:hypothetical protein
MFGKADSITWIKASSEIERTQVAAAHMQHAYCWAIRQRSVERFGSVKAYAAHAGLPYERLARVTRGQAPLKFEDVGAARIHLGDVHEIAQRVLTTPMVYATP